MTINIATWDRALRMIIGVALLSWAIAGGPVWAYLGLAFIITAAWRFDPIYALFRISTYRA